MTRNPTNVWELIAMRTCCSELFKLWPLHQLVIRITSCLYSHSYELQILCLWNTVNTELTITPMLQIQITHFLRRFPKFLFKKPKRPTNFPNFISSKSSTCFGSFLCPSSGLFYCTFDIGIFLAGLMTVVIKPARNIPMSNI